MHKRLLAMCFSCAFIVSAYANETVTVSLTADKGHGKELGTVTFSDSAYGLMITPKLTGLPPGAHGFHFHTNPTCDEKGMSAGGHYDPKKTNKHLGPYNAHGHLGDLPVLFVDTQGNANTPMVAPRVKLSDIKQRALMIHDHGDNYSDQPTANGGGGDRLACAVITH